MKNRYTDILFAIYINGGEGTLNWLAGYLYDNQFKDIQQCLGAMVSAKLIKISLTDQEITVTLTEKGEDTAIAVADIISNRMIDQWRKDQKSLAY